MTSPDAASQYEVRETPEFQADWRLGMELGYINPMTDPPDLLFFKRLLAERPYSGRQLPGVPYNVRSFAFPRINGPPILHLWYSIVEDDRIVYLEALYHINPN